MSELRSVSTQAKFCKKDFLMMYDNVSIDVFEEWIEDIKEEIGWKPKGKQIFGPRQAKRIIEYVGPPLQLKLLNQ